MLEETDLMNFAVDPSTRFDQIVKLKYQVKAEDANFTQDNADGYKYRGRGLVQLTWKANYKKFNIPLGMNFVENPELALNLKTATRIMLLGMRDGIFTEGVHKLSKYLSKSATKNYFQARQIINATDKAIVFERYAERFEAILLRI